jgi:CubicO group peptidase (beta-lactamase class C family)
MRRLILTLASMLLLCGYGAAQSLTPTEISKINEIFSDYAKTDSPGCALGVYRNGAIAYARGYGMASLELGVPITPQTVFDIGSTSKQFTAFSILLLQQQGKLSVDDDIRKFIPEIPDYGKRITLHHLMTHTSGLRDYAGLFDLAGVPEQNLTNDQDAVDLIVRQKALNFMPGEEWDYSNTGFFLLSQVVKRVTSKSLRDFDQENIFKPLGMSSTQIFNDHTLVIPHRATGYSYDDDRKTFGVEMSNFEQTGDGSVQTSVEDLLRWDENYYSAKLGGADLIRQMQVVGKLNNGKEHGYAAGLEISTYRGQSVVSHGGAWAGYRAELMRFPGQHTSVAVLCNVAQAMPTVWAYRVADIVLANVLAPTPASSGNKQVVASVSPAVLQSYAGIYKNEKDEYQRIEFKDGKLWLASYGIELIPRSTAVFGTNLGEGSISFSEKQMVMALNPEDPQKFALLDAHAPQDIAQFTGDYYSVELDAAWQLRVQDGQLTAHVKNSDSPAMTLSPVTEDTFTLEGGSLRFEPQGSGTKRRALLTVSRIRNISFVKE